MSTIDIRSPEPAEITQISFAEEFGTTNDHIGNKVKKCRFNKLEIHDNLDHVVIPTKTDAENLILALQKAIELGWFD